jgi:hypothetical protein
MSKLLFNRYHFLTSIDVKDKLDFLSTGISEGASYSNGNFVYKFIETESISDETSQYIVGYLVKYSPHGYGEVFDETSGTVKYGEIKNKVIAKSLFIIDLLESVIVFQEVYNLLTKGIFIRAFNQLFSSQFEMFVEFEISGIKEQYSFINQVKKLKKIERISISLVPSNPRFAENWKDIDERMRENNIDKYKEIQESTKGDFGIKLDKETEGKLQMSEDGYGESKASGIDENGNEIMISTVTKNQDVNEILPKEIENRGAKSVLRFIHGTLQRIKDRTNKYE